MLKITACPHTDRKYRSRGMCNACYLKQNGGSKNWYVRNKQLAKDRASDWSKKNHERRKKIARMSAKRCYEKNPEKFLARHRASLKSNINLYLTVCLRSRLRHALRGKAKAKHTLELLGCSIEFLKTYLEKKFTEGMSWENYGSWHVDHIRPCASFDLSDPDQQKICFHYTNLQPLWAFENQSKGAA